ncbi:Protein of unknown function [Pyronema omphalodes CBS 100304]|uniref:Uncharacterized protein n=1 Tax=Pyronema omphalodes (strain CBS 100304) TaxID=1076935 RepID=U4L350_PYROM|nr:Protein of unknown function [Pyronema omphalodes CBS 100304]
MRADRGAMRESCALASQHRSTVEIRNGVPPVLSIYRQQDRQVDPGRREAGLSSITTLDLTRFLVLTVAGRSSSSYRAEFERRELVGIRRSDGSTRLKFR